MQQSNLPNLTIRSYAPADDAAVVALWHACGLIRPQNDPVKDIARKLAVNPELFLVAVIDNTIVGTVMAGYEGHRGAINYLAVVPGQRRNGIGRRLMAEAEARLRDLGCAKINLNVRGSNTEVIAFYERIGFSIDPVLTLGKRLAFDEPGSDSG